MTRLSEVIGQKTATTILGKALREDRVSHAYLFVGPEGAGKLTTALAFAAALNCEERTQSGDSCGNCISCHMMSGSGHPDVQVVSPDGADTKIRQMRDMLKSTRYAPLRGKWKVVIVEQADTLNEDSSSAILKTLEEPPPYLVMFLLSRNPVLVLPTIRSRCLAVRFSTAGADELARALTDRFGATQEEAGFLAAYSVGRPGIAISLLGNEAFADWRRRLVDLATKVASSSDQCAMKLSSDLQRLAAGETDEEEPEQSEAAEDGEPEERRAKPSTKGKRAAMLRTLDSLVVWYRDVLCLAVRGESADIVNSDMREQLASCVTDSARITRGIETLLWARRAIEANGNVQIISDTAMVRLTR